MDTHTLENTVSILKRILDGHQSQLGTSVVVEIKVAIADLEQCRGAEEDVGPERTQRILELMGAAVRLLTNLSDFMG